MINFGFLDDLLESKRIYISRGIRSDVPEVAETEVKKKKKLQLLRLSLRNFSFFFFFKSKKDKNEAQKEDSNAEHVKALDDFFLTSLTATVAVSDVEKKSSGSRKKAKNKVAPVLGDHHLQQSSFTITSPEER